MGWVRRSGAPEAIEANVVSAPVVPGQCSAVGRPHDCVDHGCAGQRYCESKVQVGIYIHDRTMWVETPKRRVRNLKEFVERGDKADKVLGWELHPDNGEWAATKKCGQLWLRKCDTIPGQIKAEIKCWGSRTTSLRTNEGQPIQNNG